MTLPPRDALSGGRLPIVTIVLVALNVLVYLVGMLPAERQVAGSANNQLADEVIHGEALKKMGILYAPDYVINAGGLINVSEELGGYNGERAKKRVEKIYDNLTRVFTLADELGIPPHQAAEKVALERIAMVRPIADVYTGRARTSWQHKPIALQHNG